MFGSIGGPEILLIFVLGLLLFGPRKLPEIGRTIGKTLAEFRRATSDFNASLEREVELEKLKEIRILPDSADSAPGTAPQPSPGAPTAATGSVAREVRTAGPGTPAAPLDVPPEPPAPTDV